MSESVTLRRMTTADIPQGMLLKTLAGWNQLPVDWERFLEFEPDGCFVAEHEGHFAGTATTIAYEQLFGWVGMVLVHPDMRRKGIGTALLMGGIEYLEHYGVAAVKLDATPQGKQLYDTIGFVDEYVLERWQGPGVAGSPPAGLQPLTLADLPALAEFDQPIFGADRRRVLQRLVTEPTIRTAAAWDGDRLRGYGAVRPGQNACYLGPWIATDPEVAAALWAWGRATVGPQPLFVDVMLPCPGALPLVEQSGFAKQRHLIRMYRGENVSPGHPELQYGVFGPEIG